MRIALNVLGMLLVMTGFVWSLQGAGFLGGSFMTGESQWLVIGVVCLVAGAVILAWANRRALGGR